MADKLPDIKTEAKILASEASSGGTKKAIDEANDYLKKWQQENPGQSLQEASLALTEQVMQYCGFPLLQAEFGKADLSGVFGKDEASFKDNLLDFQKHAGDQNDPRFDPMGYALAQKLLGKLDAIAQEADPSQPTSFNDLVENYFQKRSEQVTINGSGILYLDKSQQPQVSEIVYTDPTGKVITDANGKSVNADIIRDSSGNISRIETNNPALARFLDPTAVPDSLGNFVIKPGNGKVSVDASGNFIVQTESGSQVFQLDSTILKRDANQLVTEIDKQGQTPVKVDNTYFTVADELGRAYSSKTDPTERARLLQQANAQIAAYLKDNPDDKSFMDKVIAQLERNGTLGDALQGMFAGDQAQVWRDKINGSNGDWYLHGDKLKDFADKVDPNSTEDLYFVGKLLAKGYLQNFAAIDVASNGGSADGLAGDNDLKAWATKGQARSYSESILGAIENVRGVKIFEDLRYGREITKDEISKALGDPTLSAENKKLLQYISDNFDKIAGENGGALNRYAFQKFATDSGSSTEIALSQAKLLQSPADSPSTWAVNPSEMDQVAQQIRYWSGIDSVASVNSADSDKIIGELRNMTLEQRQALERAYEDRYHKSLRADLQWKLGDRWSEAEIILDTEDGKANIVGHIDNALDVMAKEEQRRQLSADEGGNLPDQSDAAKGAEKDVFEALSVLNSQELANLRADYLAKHGITLDQALSNAVGMNDSTKAALQIYLDAGGVDKLSVDQIKKLAQIALDSKDIHMLQAVFRSAGDSQYDKNVVTARSSFTDDQIKKAFSDGNDQALALDYLHFGHAQLVTIAKQDTHWLHTNKEAIVQALEAATPEEKAMFTRGRDIALGRISGVDPNSLDANSPDGKAYQYYKTLHTAFTGSGSIGDAAAYDWEINGWEAKLAYPSSSFINDFAQTHHDGALGSGVGSWTDSHAIYNVFNNMGKSDWDMLHVAGKGLYEIDPLTNKPKLGADGKPISDLSADEKDRYNQGKALEQQDQSKLTDDQKKLVAFAQSVDFNTDIDHALGDIWMNDDDRAHVNVLLSYKRSAQSFDESQETPDVLTRFDLYHGGGAFGTYYKDRKQLIDAVLNMSKDQQQQYRQGEKLLQSLNLSDSDLSNYKLWLQGDAWQPPDSVAKLSKQDQALLKFAVQLDQAVKDDLDSGAMQSGARRYLDQLATSPASALKDGRLAPDAVTRFLQDGSKEVSALQLSNDIAADRAGLQAWVNASPDNAALYKQIMEKALENFSQNAVAAAPVVYDAMGMPSGGDYLDQVTQNSDKLADRLLSGAPPLSLDEKLSLTSSKAEMFKAFEGASPDEMMMIAWASTTDPSDPKYMDLQAYAEKASAQNPNWKVQAQALEGHLISNLDSDDRKLFLSIAHDAQFFKPAGGGDGKGGGGAAAGGDGSGNSGGDKPPNLSLTREATIRAFVLGYGDEASVRAILQTSTPEQIKQMKDDYYARFGTDLQADLVNKVDAGEQNKYMDWLASTRIDATADFLRKEHQVTSSYSILDGFMKSSWDGTQSQSYQALDNYAAQVANFNAKFDTMPVDMQRDLSEKMDAALKAYRDSKAQLTEQLVEQTIMLATMIATMGMSAAAIEMTMAAKAALFAASAALFKYGATHVLEGSDCDNSGENTIKLLVTGAFSGAFAAVTPENFLEFGSMAAEKLGVDGLVSFGQKATDDIVQSMLEKAGLSQLTDLVDEKAAAEITQELDEKVGALVRQSIATGKNVDEGVLQATLSKIVENNPELAAALEAHPELAGSLFAGLKDGFKEYQPEVANKVLNFIQQQARGLAGGQVTVQVTTTISTTVNYLMDKMFRGQPIVFSDLAHQVLEADKNSIGTAFVFHFAMQAVTNWVPTIAKQGLGKMVDIVNVSTADTVPETNTKTAAGSSDTATTVPDTTKAQATSTVADNQPTSGGDNTNSGTNTNTQPEGQSGQAGGGSDSTNQPANSQFKSTSQNISSGPTADAVGDIHLPDGEVVHPGDQGYNRSADGSITYKDADGKTYIFEPDGSRITEDPAKGLVTQQLADGTEVVRSFQSDGTTVDQTILVKPIAGVTDGEAGDAVRVVVPGESPLELGAANEVVTTESGDKYILAQDKATGETNWYELVAADAQTETTASAALGEGGDTQTSFLTPNTTPESDPVVLSELNGTAGVDTQPVEAAQMVQPDQPRALPDNFNWIPETVVEPQGAVNAASENGGSAQPDLIASEKPAAEIPEIKWIEGTKIGDSAFSAATEDAVTAKIVENGNNGGFDQTLRDIAKAAFGSSSDESVARLLNDSKYDYVKEAVLDGLIRHEILTGTVPEPADLKFQVIDGKLVVVSGAEAPASQPAITLAANAPDTMKLIAASILGEDASVPQSTMARLKVSIGDLDEFRNQLSQKGYTPLQIEDIIARSQSVLQTGRVPELASFANPVAMAAGLPSANGVPVSVTPLSVNMISADSLAPAATSTAPLFARTATSFEGFGPADSPLMQPLDRLSVNDQTPSGTSFDRGNGEAGTRGIAGDGGNDGTNGSNISNSSNSNLPKAGLDQGFGGNPDLVHDPRFLAQLGASVTPDQIADVLKLAPSFAGNGPMDLAAIDRLAGQVGLSRDTVITLLRKTTNISVDLTAIPDDPEQASGMSLQSTSQGNNSSNTANQALDVPGSSGTASGGEDGTPTAGGVVNGANDPSSLASVTNQNGSVDPDPSATTNKSKSAQQSTDGVADTQLSKGGKDATAVTPLSDRNDLKGSSVDLGASPEKLPLANSEEDIYWAQASNGDTKTDVLFHTLRGGQDTSLYEVRMHNEVTASDLITDNLFGTVPPTVEATAEIDGESVDGWIQKRNQDLESSLRDYAFDKSGSRSDEAVMDIVKNDAEVRNSLIEAIVERGILGDGDDKADNFGWSTESGQVKVLIRDLEFAYGEGEVPVLGHNAFGIMDEIVNSLAGEELSLDQVAKLESFVAKFDDPNFVDALRARGFDDAQIAALRARADWYATEGKLPQTEASLYAASQSDAVDDFSADQASDSDPAGSASDGGARTDFGKPETPETRFYQVDAADSESTSRYDPPDLKKLTNEQLIELIEQIGGPYRLVGRMESVVSQFGEMINDWQINQPEIEESWNTEVSIRKLLLNVESDFEATRANTIESFGLEDNESTLSTPSALREFLAEQYKAQRATTDGLLWVRRSQLAELYQRTFEALGLPAPEFHWSDYLSARGAGGFFSSSTNEIFLSRSEIASGGDTDLFVKLFHEALHADQQYTRLRLVYDDLRLNGDVTPEDLIAGYKKATAPLEPGTGESIVDEGSSLPLRYAKQVLALLEYEPPLTESERVFATSLAENVLNYETPSRRFGDSATFYDFIEKQLQRFEGANGERSAVRWLAGRLDFEGLDELPQFQQVLDDAWESLTAKSTRLDPQLKEELGALLKAQMDGTTNGEQARTILASILRTRLEDINEWRQGQWEAYAGVDKPLEYHVMLLTELARRSLVDNMGGETQAADLEPYFSQRPASYDGNSDDWFSVSADSEHSEFDLEKENNSGDEYDREAAKVRTEPIPGNFDKRGMWNNEGIDNWPKETVLAIINRLEKYYQLGDRDFIDSFRGRLKELIENWDVEADRTAVRRYESSSARLDELDPVFGEVYKKLFSLYRNSPEVPEDIPGEWSTMDEWLGFFQNHSEELSQLNFSPEDQALCLEFALTSESANSLHREIQSTKLEHLWQLKALMNELTEDRTPSVELTFEQNKENAGSFGRGLLALNPEDLVTLPNGAADLIDTCLHELIHNEQNTLMLRSVIDDLEASGRDITYDNIRSEFKALSGSNVSNEYIDKVFALRDGPLSSDTFEYAQKVLGPAFRETRNVGEGYHRSADTFRALSDLERSLTGSQPGPALEDLFYAINQDDPFGAKLFGAEFMSDEESNNLVLKFDRLRNKYLAADGDPLLLEPILEKTIRMIDFAKRNINNWRENAWSDYAGKDHELDAWVGGFLTTIDPIKLAESYQEAGQITDASLLSIPNDDLGGDSAMTDADGGDSNTTLRKIKTLAKFEEENSSDSVTILEPKSDNPYAWLPGKPIAERTPEELTVLRTKLGKLLSPLAAPETVDKFVSKLFEITSSWDSDPSLAQMRSERDDLISELSGIKGILRNHGLITSTGEPSADLASYAQEAELPLLPELERRYTEIQSLLDPGRSPDGPQALLDAAREPRRLALQEAVNQMLSEKGLADVTIILKTGSQLGNVAAQLDGLNLEINGDLLDSSFSIDRIANRVLHEAVHEEQDALIFANAARELGFDKNSKLTGRDLYAIADQIKNATGRDIDFATLKKFAAKGLPELTADQIQRAQSLARDYSASSLQTTKDVFDATDRSLNRGRAALDSLIDSEGRPDPQGVLNILNSVLGARSETQFDVILQDLFGIPDIPEPLQEMVDRWLNNYLEAESLVRMRTPDESPEFEQKVIELFNELLTNDSSLMSSENAQLLIDQIKNGVDVHNAGRRAAWDAYYTSLPEEDAVVAGASAGNQAVDSLFNRLFPTGSDAATSADSILPIGQASDPATSIDPQSNLGQPSISAPSLSSSELLDESAVLATPGKFLANESEQTVTIGNTEIELNNFHQLAADLAVDGQLSSAGINQLAQRLGLSSAEVIYLLEQFHPEITIEVADVSSDSTNTTGSSDVSPDDSGAENNVLYRQRGEHPDDWRAPGQPEDFEQLTEQQIIEAYQNVPNGYRLKDPVVLQELVDILRNDVFPLWDATDQSFFQSLGELDETVQSTDFLYLRSRLNEISARFQTTLGAADPEVPIELEEAYSAVFDKLLTDQITEYDHALQGQSSEDQFAELTAKRNQAQADLDTIRQFLAARKEVATAQGAFKQIEADRLQVLNSALRDFIRNRLGVPDVPFFVGSDAEGEFTPEGIAIDREYLAFHGKRGDAVNTIAHELSHDEQLALRMKAAQEQASKPLRPSTLSDQVLDYSDPASKAYAKDAIALGGTAPLTADAMGLAETLQQEYAEMDVSDPDQMAAAMNLLRSLEVAVADVQNGNGDSVAESLMDRSPDVREFWDEVIAKSKPGDRIELRDVTMKIRALLQRGQLVTPELIERLSTVLDSVRSDVHDDLEAQWEDYTTTETERHSSAIGDFAQLLYEGTDSSAAPASENLDPSQDPDQVAEKTEANSYDSARSVPDSRDFEGDQTNAGDDLSDDDQGIVLGDSKEKKVFLLDLDQTIMHRQELTGITDRMRSTYENAGAQITPTEKGFLVTMLRPGAGEFIQQLATKGDVYILTDSLSQRTIDALGLYDINVGDNEPLKAVYGRDNIGQLQLDSGHKAVMVDDLTGEKLKMKMARMGLYDPASDVMTYPALGNSFSDFEANSVAVEPFYPGKDVPSLDSYISDALEKAGAGDHSLGATDRIRPVSIERELGPGKYFTPQ